MSHEKGIRNILMEWFAYGVIGLLVAYDGLHLLSTMCSVIGVYILSHSEAFLKDSVKALGCLTMVGILLIFVAYATWHWTTQLRDAGNAIEQLCLKGNSGACTIYDDYFMPSEPIESE